MPGVRAREHLSAHTFAYPAENLAVAFDLVD
jgi:hypothetical protein